ncbi:MAG: hypothetical protein UV02_C0012G0019 [Candidatus Kuenenbacteria bacterium GW2011_GWA2_42_15]|uniref:Uncharacterized protein n=2 Tax=Candidatus Kueneniibacteriota TaxID=1752740 RepID=A0A0G1B874_9BACT|nr:MAG: hypothetical protein UV02_C0012G0019 [Candidatus Kuenenbacteria bacterium GW2011_GWA2_42_15]
MNEKILRPGRFRRKCLMELILHYKPPHKRKKIPTVYSWDELAALTAKNNPPPKAIFILEGKKLEIAFNRRGEKWIFSVMGAATS